VTTIEVFADVWCPFTHVGLKRWTARRAEVGREDVALRVRAWPLELVNGAPLSVDLVEHEVGDLRSQVAADLFLGLHTDQFPTTTLPALQLTARAYEVGDAAGEAVALELRDRLFERGEDISDEDLLGEIGRTHRVPEPVPGQPDAVLADLDEGRRRGVIGSPHFFGPDIDVFCPTLRIERDGEHFRIEEARSRFDDLCAASFA
jgi:hypothetical protein